jgi:hypothetical protein
VPDDRFSQSAGRTSIDDRFADHAEV